MKLEGFDVDLRGCLSRSRERDGAGTAEQQYSRREGYFHYKHDPVPVKVYTHDIPL